MPYYHALKVRPGRQEEHARSARSAFDLAVKHLNAAGGDFLFRTVLSDRAQGPVLARVTRERGFDNVGVIYRNDA